MSTRFKTMTLPPSYNTSKEYLTECLSFLKSFQWLFNYNNTHILVNKILNNFPSDWYEYFKSLSNDELNKLPGGHSTESCPSCLKNVLSTIGKLKPNITSHTQKCDHNLSHNSGLSRKKRHEITYLAPIIDKLCKENLINCVIDVGAGLGYLSHLLNSCYKYSVLGVECSAEYIKLACKNQHKFYPNSKDHVKFTEHFINEDSCCRLKTLAEEHFSNISAKSGCIVGLHACADLSIIILNIFTNLDFVKCLVIMPCCYHRIELDKTVGENEYFKNFPSSKLFKDMFEEFEAEAFIRRPFLRLACQETMESFRTMTSEEHEQHSRDCMYRAILQEVVERENCKVRRLKRKSKKSQDFEAYLKNLENTHQLEYDDKSINEKLQVNDERFFKKMREKWNEHKGNCYLVEVLTGFQAAIQSICENLILLDRVEFLKERGFRCYIQKVTNDRISPRCHALIAIKQ